MPLEVKAKASQIGEGHPVRVVPPDRALGIWGAYRAARRNLLELIPEAAYREPVVPGDRGLGPGWLMVMDPPWLEHVLKTREPDYPKSDISRRILKPRDGENVFTAHGADWRRQHRAMAPVFQHKALVSYVPVVSRAAEAASDRLRAAASSRDGVADVYPAMVGATTDVILDIALSGREALDRASLNASVTRFVETVGRTSLLDILDAPAWVPRPARLFDRSIRRMDAFMDRIIADRRARGPAAVPDLLDRLLTAVDPQTGEPLTDVELRNNLLVFIVAGYETTALALTWALYLLAAHPEAQARIRESLAFLDGRAPAAEDFPRLGPVRQIVEEAMRLYPPGALLSRKALAEDEIAGHPVRPGMLIILPIYALHRHQAIWSAPDRFDPARFAPEAAKERHRFSYLPFSAGPRICLGLALAMMEAQVILATLVGRFEIGLAPQTRPQPRMTVTLRPEGGMPLRLTRL
ncbi:MAG: cytochrome P450 [Pikeienuella sp.]